ncbi:phosphatidate cytidylyltransferase [Umbelopsis sp. PMI_123]|nr:phosphatidate cytidylyltransferase [Umbelopsis sp. PMI_123]
MARKSNGVSNGKPNGKGHSATNGHSKPDRYSHIQPKGSWEIPRKVFHYSIGFVVLYLYTHGYEPSDIYPVLTGILAIVGSAEVLRFSSSWFNSIYISLLGPMMRKTEISSRVNGVVYYLLDPTASICGRLFGQYTPKFSNKSLAGSLGAATIGALVTYQFYNHMIAQGYSHPSYASNAPVSLTQVSIYGGFVAAFSEAIGGVANIDDNLTIPVISGTLLWFALEFLGYGH